MMTTPASTPLAAQLSGPSDFEPEGKPVTGRKVLLIVLAFFAVVIAVNMIMLYFALTNFSGLVVKNSYVASQKFAEHVARGRAAPLTGWRVEAALEGGVVTLSIVDADGAPLRGAKIAGVLGRPSHEREDTSVAFVETAPGTYSADSAVGAGAWRLRVSEAGAPDVARGFDLYAPEGAQGLGAATGDGS